MHNNRISRFDFPGFFEAINAIRMSQNKSRKQVAEEAGISPSTLTHMAQGYRPDPDTMAALIDWSGLDFKSFIYKHTGNTETVKLDVVVSRLIGTLMAEFHLSAKLSTTIAIVVKAIIDLEARN